MQLKALIVGDCGLTVLFASNCARSGQLQPLLGGTAQVGMRAHSDGLPQLYVSHAHFNSLLNC